MDWDDYKYLSAVVESGSVRGAAKVLGVNASTVSRRLERFEARVGVPLFHRLATGLELTELGEAVARDAARLADEFTALEGRLRGQDPRLSGRIRVQVDATIWSAALAEALARFRRTHTDITLDFANTQTMLAFNRGELDVALRVVDQPEQTLVGRALGRCAAANFAAPGSGAATWLRWQGGGYLESLDAELRARDFGSLRDGHSSASFDVHTQALKAGLGTGVLPCVVGDQVDGLERVGGAPSLGPPLWLIVHPDVRGAGRIQAFTSFIRSFFAEHVDLLEGRRGK